MPYKRLSMRKIRQILKLKYDRDYSIRAIAQSISASSSTVFECLTRAQAAGLCWPQAADLDDTTLENMLYPSPPGAGYRRAQPDFEHIHREMRRKGVTLHLLWQEYKANHPEDGYQYSKFCEHYSRWRKKVDVVMRQNHRAGEKMFVDFSGDGIEIIDPPTGEIRQAPLFLAVLGASSYTYAEAFENQQLPCWIDGHIHAFEYFDGVVEITVPDNTKTGVKHPCYYEPDLNATYLDLAEHYDTTVIPARVRKARDKAKVESAVLVALRWILAALRNHSFFSLRQANEAIAEKLEELNRRPFQKLTGSRRSLYETIDRAALKPLPMTRYEFAEWSKPRVNIDYHVDVHKHYYSVPYSLVHERVEARTTATTVEILFKSKRVASHKRSYLKGRFTTCKEHMPKEHQQYLEWSPSRILAWARKTGPATGSLAEKIMAARRHPEQGYRACLGLVRLGKAYGNDRLEAACVRALDIGTHSYKSVQSILKNKLDSQPPCKESEEAQPALIEHENIRGSDYYQ